MKIYISEKAGCAYWIENFQFLMACPLNKDGSFDTEDGFEVDLGLKDEPVNEPITLGEIWEEARKALL